MNIKETFLKLTEFLVPYKMENLLESFLPEGIQKDSTGNYHIKIGETRTMFTCHLDSYTKKLHKVEHVLFDDGKKVTTDGTSPLGGDDKTGMCIMLNMIEHKVPGHYFFFIGEEPPLSGGVFGSSSALNKDTEFFKNNFDKVIAFDRKGYTSIISKQRGSTCCSKEFVDALSEEFAKQGLEYEDDPTGYYTDSAVFMYTCPEITNISCGGFDEHKNTEWVDLEYLTKLADVCTKINWESLPVKRDPLKYAPKPKLYQALQPMLRNIYKKNSGIFNFNAFNSRRGYDLYRVIRDYYDYYDIHPKEGQRFVEGKSVIFARDTDKGYSKNTLIYLRITGAQIWVNNNKVGSLDAFERRYDIGFDCKFFKFADEFLEDLQDYKRIYKTDKIPYKDVQVLLKKYGNFSVNQLLFNMDSKNAIYDEDDFYVDETNKCLWL